MGSTARGAGIGSNQYTTRAAPVDRGRSETSAVIQHADPSDDVDASVAAAAFASDGLAPWGSFTRPEIAAWFNAGVPPAFASVWYGAAIHPVDAGQWIAAFAPDGINIFNALALIDLGVSPTDARAMCDSGHWTGFWPDDVRTWKEAGCPTDDPCEA